MTDEKVIYLPVHPRPRELTLHVVHFDRARPCTHRDVSYGIRPGEADVECCACHARLDPMFVLMELAHMESRWMNARRASIEIRKELEQRTRCKCEHCGRMTNIRLRGRP